MFKSEKKAKKFVIKKKGESHLPMHVEMHDMVGIVHREFLNSFAKKKKQHESNIRQRVELFNIHSIGSQRTSVKNLSKKETGKPFCPLQLIAYLIGKIQ
jgi:hypothetical protein